VLMVTHELDIATYAKRNIIVRDGLVVADRVVENRLIATEELRKLDTAHQAMNIGH